MLLPGIERPWMSSGSYGYHPSFIIIIIWYLCWYLYVHVYVRVFFLFFLFLFFFYCLFLCSNMCSLFGRRRRKDARLASRSRALYFENEKRKKKKKNATQKPLRSSGSLLCRARALWTFREDWKPWSGASASDLTHSHTIVHAGLHLTDLHIQYTAVMHKIYRALLYLVIYLSNYLLNYLFIYLLRQARLSWWRR